MEHYPSINLPPFVKLIFAIILLCFLEPKETQTISSYFHDACLILHHHPTFGATITGGTRKGTSGSDLCFHGHQKALGEHATQLFRVSNRYTEPSPIEFYSQWVRPGLPLVIRGALNQSFAVRYWTRNTSHFIDLAKDYEFRITVKRLFDYDNHHSIKLSMTMGQFMKFGKTMSLSMRSPIPESIEKEIHWPNILNCPAIFNKQLSTWLLMENSVDRTPIRVNFGERMFLQLTGSSQFFLVSPRDGDKMYTHAFPNHSGISPVDPNHVNFNLYPEVISSRIYAASLTSGDFIYIPEGWHYSFKRSNSSNIIAEIDFHLTECKHHLPNLDTDENAMTCLNLRQKMTKGLCSDVFPHRNTFHSIRQKSGDKERPFVVNTRADKLNILKQQRLKRKEKDTKLGLLSLQINSTKFNDSSLVSLLQGSLQIGYNSYFLDGMSTASAQALSMAWHSQNISRQDLFIAIYLSFQMFSNGTKNQIHSIVHNNLLALNTSYFDLLVVQGPQYDIRHQTPAGLDRLQINHKWLRNWRYLESLSSFAKNRIVKQLGVADFSKKEVVHLLRHCRIVDKTHKNGEIIKETSLRVVQARFDPLHRNRLLMTFAQSHNLQFVATGVAGNNWVEDGMYHVNPIHANSNLKSIAFTHTVSIDSLSYEWALYRDTRIVIPLQYLYNGSSCEEARCLIKLKSDFETVLNMLDKQINTVNAMKTIQKLLNEDLDVDINVWNFSHL